MAVGNSDGATVKFTGRSDSTGAQVVVMNGEHEQTVSPDFGGDFPVNIDKSKMHVLAAKIDVQGFEPQVFSGMKEAIQMHHCRQCLQHDLVKPSRLGSMLPVCLIPGGQNEKREILTAV